MINMTIKESCTALSLICSKIGIFAGFSLYNINFDGRNSEAAMGGGIVFLGATYSSSIRVQRSSEECSVAPKGAA
jgi:hypothetical protein